MDDTKKLKWNNYMKEYRKRGYVKKKYHEYYINRIIRQAAEDNEKRKRQTVGREVPSV
jgi:hypothetical protein